MAIKTNLTVDQGSNFIYKVFLIDQDGLPFNIDGYTGNAQIRKTYTSSGYSTMNVAISGNSGLVTLTMNSATTANLKFTRYIYDVELISNTNVTSRIIEGIVTVNLEVTR
jgi:hypothetical protein